MNESLTNYFGLNKYFLIKTQSGNKCILRVWVLRLELVYTTLFKIQKISFVFSLLLFVILLFSVILFYSRLRWIQFWVWIELNQLFFLFFISLFFLTKIETIIKYFIIQRITSIVIIIILVLTKSDLFILRVLFLKLGLIPLHSWILNIVKSIELFSYFTLLTVQKIQLLLIFLFLIKTYLNQFLILLIILSSYLIIIKETFGKKFFFFSSINFLFLFILLGYFSLSLRFFFWLSYLLFFFFLLFTFLLNSFTFFLFKNKIITSLLLLVIIGFPPFPIFFF